MAPLEALGFALAGYGCTTCIGNSGPLDDAVAAAIEANDLVVAAVLSGNRNFEGRIHPLARASYLASPPLVVAFALAGRVDIDLTTEPLGTRIGRPARSTSPTSGRSPRRSGRSSASRSTRSCSGGPTRPCSTATTAGARCRSRRATDTPGTRPRPTSRSRRSSTVSARKAGGDAGSDGPARARGPRRLGHDRPHLARRLDRAIVARRHSGSRSTASRRSSSTHTAPGVATTR